MQKRGNLKKCGLHKLEPGVRNFLFAIVILGMMPAFGRAQDLPPPATPFEEILQQMKFETPTRIVGRLRSIDGYEDAIWIDWTHRYDGTRWVPMRNEMMLKVMPRDREMMSFFRTLKPGVSLHMTIQEQDGDRRILQLDET
jgi:hypothetical protein